jgi:hypothetical protein
MSNNSVVSSRSRGRTMSVALRRSAIAWLSARQAFFFIGGEGREGEREREKEYKDERS